MRDARGRRPDPGPSAPPVTASQGCETVIAWLLRVNRIYGKDESLAVAARFIRAFSGGPEGIPASESQISRWERATLRVTPGVIRRYEQVLDLCDGRIGAVAHTLYRESLGRLGPPALRAAVNADDGAARDGLSQLLDRALGAEVMSGRDWDELSAGLWTVPVLLHPRRLFDQLADRLLGEMLIAEGTAWLLRCEAINRLLGVRDGTFAVIEACTTVIEDHRSQILIEPMALLEMTPHPAAASQLLRQIDCPGNDHALRAAWWAVAEKAGRGHFRPEQLHQLSSAAADTLQDNSSHLACRVAAAETVRQVLPAATPATRRMLTKATKDDLVTNNVLRSGRTCARETVQAVAHRLGDSALALMHQGILRRDPVLTWLITEMLFHPQGTRRVVAAQAIAATPYRPALARAIAHELGKSATLANPTLATPLVQALGHLGGAPEIPLVWRLLLSRNLPAPISESAAWIVGHLRAEPDTHPWPHAVSRLLRERDNPLRCDAKALLYSLGTAGRRHDLTNLLTAPDLHPDLRTAAQWWLNIPEIIQRSAQS
ncbi:hypothetical protein Rhe02_35320 [Rhizocola hellebori]|uniref:Uncharacterized protein n=1 Tax=Rhizocola hellebori TaxID=1392758 RepID=A0A8J3Q9E6_9ACTN|nr:hypothetical protein [Rhizocola hellebori]GIH05465.1 hypothetical protein Rhe02_35320 [Rhizocola hellebori]